MSTSSNDLSERLRIERQTVETFYRAFSDKNPDLVDEVLAPTWNDIPLAPGQGAGPEGVKPIIRSVIQAFPDVQITIHDMIQEPGRIAARAEISGTHQGELFGIAPTGKAVSFRLHEFHTLNGKRITTTWHMEDWFGLFLQLGQFPKQLKPTQICEASMKAALLKTFGVPVNIMVGDAPLRELQPNEALVNVEVAGANPLDLKIISGYMQQVFPVELPYVPGTDFSGVIDAVGAEVTNLRPGDRVFGRSPPSAGGAFARNLVISARDLCVIPPEMSFEQAAALPTAFGTARQALFDVGQLQRGQRVLIHAGAGGVGSMAVQQAHHAGAYVIATASARNVELVQSLGADEIIDYRTEDFTQVRDIDLVLDTVGGETLEKSWSVLRAGGHIASLVEFDIKSRSGQVGEFVFFASATPFLPGAIGQFQAGHLQVITDSIFPLDEVRLALEKLATGHACGKILVRLND